MNLDIDALTLDRWDALTEGDQETVARDIARVLGDPWTFRGIGAYAMAGQHHRIARFSWHDDVFHLVPGGMTALGYDRAHPFVPNAAQRRAWKIDLYRRQGDGEHWDWEPLDDDDSPPVRDDVADQALHEYLDTTLTSLRQCKLPAFLLEAGACLFRNVYHADVSARSAQDGFRLPTSDEWEYACAAGTRTFFRWGDDCPVEFRPDNEDEYLYQSDIDADGNVHHFVRQYIRKQPVWDAYRRPNAFGLRFPISPYKWELCADPTIMRGGDGGTTICGGEGIIKPWIALASSYAEKRHRNSDDRIPWAHLRRLYPLKQLG